MIRSVQREAMVETLLNSLAVERHARCALANELLSELAAPRYARVKDEARALVQRLERTVLTQRELSAAVEGLRANILALATS